MDGFPLRTRFKDDIVTEFLPPLHPSNKVIIFANGAPGYPNVSKRFLDYLARLGYWTFIPRYRGTWESDGYFFERPLDEDILDVVSGLEDSFIDFWSGASFKVHNPEVYLIGGSTGGAGVIWASRDPRVKKAVALSPVVDWRKQEETAEPLNLMSEYIPKAFGQGYRAKQDVWKKLAAGGFYNPVEVKDEIDGSKLMIIHGTHDFVVHFPPAEEFAKNVGARFLPLPYKGHMGAGSVRHPRIWKHVYRFLRDLPPRRWYHF